MVAICSPRLLKRRLLSLSRVQALAVSLTFGLLLLVAMFRRKSDFIDSESEAPRFYAQDQTHLHGRIGVNEDGHPTWKARRLKVSGCLGAFQRRQMLGGDNSVGNRSCLLM